MSASRHSRREFMRVAGAGAAGLAFASPAASQSRIRGANDRVRVGIVGFSDRSRTDLIPSFMKHAAELNFEVVAVSDIWSRRREEGSAFLEKLTGQKPALCRNNDPTAMVRPRGQKRHGIWEAVNYLGGDRFALLRGAVAAVDA